MPTSARPTFGNDTYLSELPLQQAEIHIQGIANYLSVSPLVRCGNVECASSRARARVLGPRRATTPPAPSRAASVVTSPQSSQPRGTAPSTTPAEQSRGGVFERTTTTAPPRVSASAAPATPTAAPLAAPLAATLACFAILLGASLGVPFIPVADAILPPRPILPPSRPPPLLLTNPFFSTRIHQQCYHS